MTTQTTITTRVNTIAQFSAYSAELSLKDLAQATTQTYQSCLKKFQTWLEERPISVQAAKQFLAEMRQRGYSPATIRLHYAVIHPLLEYLGMSLKLKLRKPQQLPTYHPTSELTAILEQSATRSDRWRRLAGRDTLLILMLALTGMRRSELLKLTPRDISDSFLYIRKAKGEKDRTIPLAGPLRAPLQLYIYNHNTPKNQPIFPITANRLYAIVKRHARAAGYDNISPHSFRHYFGTYLTERGAPLKAIQELMGHASIKTTAIYMDLVPRHLQSTIALFDANRELSTALTTTITHIDLLSNENGINTELSTIKGGKDEKNRK